MKRVKVLVGQRDTVGITCPFCRRTHRIFVTRFKGAKHALLTRCTCQKEFEIVLNFRQFHRKSVKLAGTVKRIASGAQVWCDMTVLDLSMKGLGFRLEGIADIERGHRLMVVFHLDDDRLTRLEKEVRVINIQDNRYGCEFLARRHDPELGAYLRS